jgi:hypothetical protein
LEDVLKLFTIVLEDVDIIDIHGGATTAVPLILWQWRQVFSDSRFKNACFRTEIQCSKMQNYQTRQILSISNKRSSPKQAQHFCNSHRGSGAVGFLFLLLWRVGFFLLLSRASGQFSTAVDIYGG